MGSIGLVKAVIFFTVAHRTAILKLCWSTMAISLSSFHTLFCSTLVFLLLYRNLTLHGSKRQLKSYLIEYLLHIWWV